MLEMLVHSSNRVERKSPEFKYACLGQYKNYSVRGMATVLVEQYLLNICDR